ncbi:hypothetical protein cyc_04351 [Cyclospora cayetanensis]|uniref:Uncharacterized protein n=1 Tax=Cyclospora cayetanensis TaxID=88456 RepID=A0A1D3D1K4_9EIME|nr:hypothetical protein cyc_04351 [Cyclospora cayetanensis]
MPTPLARAEELQATESYAGGAAVAANNAASAEFLSNGCSLRVQQQQQQQQQLPIQPLDKQQSEHTEESIQPQQTQKRGAVSTRFKLFGSRQHSHALYEQQQRLLLEQQALMLLLQQQLQPPPEQQLRQDDQQKCKHGARLQLPTLWTAADLKALITLLLPQRQKSDMREKQQKRLHARKKGKRPKPKKQSQIGKQQHEQPQEQERHLDEISMHWLEELGVRGMCEKVMLLLFFGYLSELDKADTLQQVITHFWKEQQAMHFALPVGQPLREEVLSPAASVRSRQRRWLQCVELCIKVFAKQQQYLWHPSLLLLAVRAGMAEGGAAAKPRILLQHSAVFCRQ